MPEFFNDDLSVADVLGHESLLAEDLVIGFLRSLPHPVARAGLDPGRAHLLIGVVPERPEGHAFDGPIFMGAGAHSELSCGLLLGRVREALSLLSGQQQNGGMGSDFDEAGDREAAERIEAIVREVAMALTGKAIDFREGAR